MKSTTHKWIVIGIFAGAAVIGMLTVAALVGLDAAEGGGLPFKRLAIVRIEGEIADAGWHTSVLREHLNDRNVVGVLLRVNSPGGGVAPSQEIYNAVAAYAAAGKPLVVSMGSVAASGGYYIAAPAKRIFASPGTLTGSIGVISLFPVYQELAKKVGVEFRVMKAGKLKDLGSPFRAMSDEESNFWQTLLDDTHEQFIQDVAAGRGVDADDIRPLADGRVLTGKQAYESKLIDTLGGYAEAMGYLRNICGIPENVKPVEKRPSTSWRELFLESAQKKLPGLSAVARPAGLYFLFMP